MISTLTLHNISFIVSPFTTHKEHISVMAALPLVLTNNTYDRYSS
jgi:hypothetical protein